MSINKYPRIELKINFDNWEKIDHNETNLCFVKEVDSEVSPNILISIREVGVSYGVAESEAEIILYIKSKKDYRIASEGVYNLNGIKWEIKEFIHTNEIGEKIVQIVAFSFFVKDNKKYSISFFGTSTIDNNGKKAYGEIQSILQTIKLSL